MIETNETKDVSACEALLHMIKTNDKQRILSACLKKSKFKHGKEAGGIIGAKEMVLIRLNRLWVRCVGLIGLVVVSGCNTQTASFAEKLTTPRIEVPQQCSGWEKIELKNSSRYALLQHDQRLVVNIDAHNLRGRNLGCWQ